MNNGDVPAMPITVLDTWGKPAAFTGMTKREQFAMTAMQGLLASDVNANLHQNDCVTLAVTHADALLEELERKNED